ncbi:alpha-amylase [Gemmatimonadetes bacterium T265]|nr:alpha-amylase [Gemmatimonadetes bacterium T265]
MPRSHAFALSLAALTACGGSDTTTAPPVVTAPSPRPTLAATYRASGHAAAGDTFVELFEWRWADVASECESMLGPAGYKAALVSAPQESAVIAGFPWWQRYQPVSYSIARSRSGTGAEFAGMVARCKAAGVDVYVDAVLNHMTAGSGTGSNGTIYTKYNYPGTWQQGDFHTPCAVSNYQDAANVQECELVGLADLNTGSASVRQKLADYLAGLARLGVAGFRLDAAKHIQPVELDSVLSLAGRTLAAEGRAVPYYFAEVVDYGGETVHATDYLGLNYTAGGASDITEFKVTGLGSKFLNTGGQRVSDLRTFSVANWGILPADKAVVFLENHDTQRDATDAGFTYRYGPLYRLGMVYLLGQPYGYPSVMSSYAFDRSTQAGRDAGPPSDAAGNTTPVTCASSLETATVGEWVCEHRDPTLRAMVAFRRAVAGTDLTWNWDDGQNAVAFSRGAKGFVAINSNGTSAHVTTAGGLAAGEYCDVLTGGHAAAGGCAGTRVTVRAGGAVDLVVPAKTAVVLEAGVGP